MRYEGMLFRPPSEANSYILQATIGCSWNHCTYCGMYRDKTFRVRDIEASLEDIDLAAAQHGSRVEKMFVADGDALILSMDHWRQILERARARFPRLRRVSCYAMARNVLAKTDTELRELRDLAQLLVHMLCRHIRLGWGIIFLSAQCWLPRCLQPYHLSGRSAS